ncbi:MAG: CapA family protein [Lachnospiraceae bacterium]
MKKFNGKLLSLLLTVALIMGMSGCGITNEVSDNDVSNVTTENVTEETTTEEPTTPPFQPTTINIKMVGDMLMHTGVSDSGLMEDGTYNYDHLFTNVKEDIQSADIAIVNQEVILGGTELGISGYPTFNAAYEVGDALVNAGFNVVLHATNHTIDKGATGVDNCINYWKTNHPEIGVLGINQTAEDVNNIYVYEQGDIKVAILNYTYGTNGIALPTGREYIVNLLDEERIVNDLKKANELADFVIVCPHWGPEYKHEPWNEPGSIYDQVGWAQLMADNGADLIIGAHPHVIQPVEWIEGANGNKTLCYWSLGNFVSNQDKAPRMVGAMADITIENNEAGQVYIKDYGVIPLVTQKLFGRGAITTYKLSDYTEELASQNGILRNDAAFSLQYCKDLCRQVFGDLYKE